MGITPQTSRASRLSRQFKQLFTMPAKPNKPGRKKTPKATKIVATSIGLTPAEKADLDQRRGDMPRGKFIAKKLKLGGKP